MWINIRARGWALAVLAALLVGLPAGVSAQQAISKELSQSQERLRAIRRERDELRGEMSRIRSQVHDVSSEVSNLQSQVSTSSKLLEELNFQLQATQAQIERTNRELLRTQEQLAKKREILDQRLRDIYKRGPLHAAQVLLMADSFSDLLNRYKYLHLVARRDQRLVAEVGLLRDQLALREQVLRRSLGDVQFLRAERMNEHVQLASLRGERSQALSSLQAEERSTAQEIDRLVRDERQLTRLIATLERKRKEAERRAAAARKAAAAKKKTAPAPVKAASTLTTADLGALRWPVEGRLIYRFGRSAQPNGTTIRWNGIGIGAPVGTPVRSVEAGTVMLAGPFEGYGPTVVLSHGEGYYSLYLYLDEVSVREGAEVARGATVGTVGGKDTPQGSHLEFQIRAPGGEAVDPLTWLQKRGRR